MEAETYNSGALVVEDVVAWAASVDPAPEVIRMNLYNPSRTSYLGGRPGPRIRRGNSALGFPPFVFCTVSPSPRMDQLLNAMRTNQFG